MPDVATLPTLQYADLPARWGVSVERTPGAFRLVVAPSGWRGVPAGYAAVALFPITMIAVIVATTLRPGGPLWSMAMNSLPYLLGLVAICAVVLTRLRQRVIYMVTADRFVRATVWPSGRGSVTSWPRQEIGTVKVNPYNGAMVVQHVGRDLMDFVVSPNREVTEFVASALDGALRGECGDFTRCADVEELLPVLRKSGTMRPSTRRLMVYLTLLTGGTGLTLFLIAGEEPIAVIGFYMMLLSVVPVGIAFGTQPKKLWV